MRYFSLIILLAHSLLVRAQPDPLTEAEQLVAQRKYESAFKVLNQADPLNGQPDLSIMKTDIVLQYFVTSIMHQLFALKDLEPGEDLMQLRGSNGQFSMFAFAPDTTLNKLIEAYPDHYALYKTLGNYYHEVHLKYAGNWIISDTVLINKFYDNYLIAYEHGVYDYWSTYGLGYALLRKNKLQQAIPFLEASIKLKDDYPSSHYNLAYTYLYTDQQKRGIECAKKAMELYDDAAYKADAARMVAVMYRELESNKKALDYFRKANTIEPGNYYTLRHLLEMEVMLGADQNRHRTTEFLMLDPANPTIYQDLIDIYQKHHLTEALIQFFKDQHRGFKNDANVNANLYFYTATLHYNNGQYQTAKDVFEEARRLFESIFEPDHGVFRAIDSYLNNM